MAGQTGDPGDKGSGVGQGQDPAAQKRKADAAAAAAAQAKAAAAAKAKAAAAAAAAAAAKNAKNNAVNQNLPSIQSNVSGPGDPGGAATSTGLSDLFPGVSGEDIQTLIQSGGYGEALRYKLGLIEADLLRLKDEADAANQRAQIALDQGKLDLAKKEEADAQAIKVQQNVLQEQQQRFTAQGNYADALMKLGETPENAYKYAFARYGLTTPQGSQSMTLPEPDAVKGMLLNPNATGQPKATSTVAPAAGTEGGVQGLMPGASGPPAGGLPPASGTPSGRRPILPGSGLDPFPRPGPIFQGGRPPLPGGGIKPPIGPLPASPLGSLAPGLGMPAPGGGVRPPIGPLPFSPLASATPAPPSPSPPAPNPPPEGQTPGFAQGGLAGLHPMAEGLMKHALDMAKQGGALLKHHLAPAPQAGGGGMGALMPSGPPAPAPYGSGAPGLPQYATGGLAGLRPVGSSMPSPGPALFDPLANGRQSLGRPFPGPAPFPWSGIGRRGPTPVPTPNPNPAPGPGSPPLPAGVYNGPSFPTSPYGVPNENQNLGGYSGPMVTLPPYLQSLFAQTGHQESGVPIEQPQDWQMPHLGTPSAQSLRFLSPDEQGNLQGFERDIEGKPIDTFKNDIAEHADQGSGLEVPHSFAKGGLAGLPSGMPQVAPYAQAGLPPTPDLYPGFALGGVAGVPTGTGKGVPLPPPQPQPGTAQVPGIGQVASGPATFGEAGPEAAVPLNSPGGPLAMQALAANQGGAPPSPPDLGALLGPTSTDVGPQTSSAILPLTNIPTQGLGPGIRSEAVGRLQQALEQAGYLQMPPSANYGFYGPVTVHAVRRFQQDQGITAGTPGIWNKQSAAALKSFLSGPASGPEGPSPYDMRGAGAPGDQTGPQPGPAAGGPPSPSGLGGMMPLGL